MKNLFRIITVMLSERSYKLMLFTITLLYLVLYMISLGNILFEGASFGSASLEWTKMFHRNGYFTFEPIYQLTAPGLTIFISPINLILGLLLSILVGLNMTVTILAFRQPAACSFNRTSGFLASVPGLLAGGACCAPALVLILGLQMSTFVVTLSQWMIPIAFGLLVLTLILILRRTNLNHLQNTNSE